MPPLLIVVDDPEAAASAGAAIPAFGPAATGVDDGELGLAGPEPVSVRPSFDIESSVAPASGAGPTARKRRVAPRPKKKRSPAMEVVKIVLGGIAGLAIAQLILWWNPWKRTDPFELAPKLGGVAPWIVPEDFRGEKKAKAGNGETTGKKTPAKPGATPSKQDELPTLSFVDPTKAGPAADPTKPKRSGRKTKPSRMGGIMGSGPGIMGSGTPVAAADVSEPEPTAIPGDPLDLGNIEPAMTDPGDDLVGDLSIDLDPTKMLDPLPTFEPEEAVTDPSDSTEATPTRFSNAPNLTGGEVNEALEDAQTIARAWNLAEDADSRELLRQTYHALAELGEAVTFAGQDGQPDEAEVTGLLKSLTEDDKKLANLGKAGGAWLQHSQRDSAGLLVLGVVKGIEQQGDLYETKFETSTGTLLSLYADTDPADAYKVDSDVLVLGAIIDDPASNLTGYEGDAESVVWSRLSVVVPKP